jgi:acetyl-CoA acetyltransferase
VPEAVIVATARTPIGRAFKGSLKDLRPDDLAAFIIRTALEKVPQLDPEDIDDLMLGCGLPGGEQGFNMARVVAVLLGYNDGAAAVVIMSDTKARELELTPLARIVATSVSALSPEIMGYGPIEASRGALARAGMTISDIDLVEINEASAAQVIPSYRDLGINIDRLNVNGGAIAVGHPFGMTGARIATTLINSLQFHDKQIGLETMYVDGGQGMALVLERLS